MKMNEFFGRDVISFSDRRKIPKLGERQQTNKDNPLKRNIFSRRNTYSEALQKHGDEQHKQSFIDILKE